MARYYVTIEVYGVEADSRTEAEAIVSEAVDAAILAVSTAPPEYAAEEEW